MKQLFIAESLRYGWKSVKSNWRLFGLLFLGVMVASIAISILASILGFSEDDQGIKSLIQLLINTFVGLGFISVALRLYEHHSATWNDFFRAADSYLKYLAGEILYIAIVVGGLILFIFPGVIWAIKYKFVGYFIADKKMGPIEALKASGRLTMGVKWDLFGFCAAVALVNLLGAVCLGIGLLVTVPVSLMATTFVYKKLQNE